MASTGTMSDYLAQMLLNASLNDGSWTQPSGVWLGFSTSTISNTTGGSDTGVSGTWTDYARYKITTTNLGAASHTNTANQKVTTQEITFDSAATTGGDIGLTDWFIADTSTAGAGNLLWYGKLDGTITVQNGNPVKVPSGNLKVQVSATPFAFV